METFELINNLIVSAADYIFGWILYLPRDLALFAVAVMTSASLSFVRRWTTDQEWLERADKDTSRLKHLIKEAKKAKDKDSARRHKDTITTIKVKSMKFEGKPLLWAIIPVALLATWAFGRLAFVPPPQGEPVTVKAYLSKAHIGQSIHIAPEDGIEATNGWVQTVVEDKAVQPVTLWDKCNARVCDFLGMTPQPEAVAEWKIVSRDAKPHMLKIRYGGRTYEKEVLAGTRHYAAPLAMFADSPVQAVELAMKPVKLFDYVGALDFLFLPPWLVAYLLIAIPFVTVLRRVFRIY